MNCSVIGERPIIPPIKSVLLVLTQEEAVELQRCITSTHIDPIKDRVYDVLTQTFRTEGINGGFYV